jgi:hypothetical protein
MSRFCMTVPAAAVDQSLITRVTWAMLARRRKICLNGACMCPGKTPLLRSPVRIGARVAATGLPQP